MIRSTVLAIVLALTTASSAVWAHDHNDMMMMADAPLAGASIYNLPSSWTNQDNIATPLPSLQGRPLVVAMIYTNCKEMCPLTVETMRQIGDEWAKHSHQTIHFALFSLDAARDTPEQLKTFAASRSLDPAQWTLFHGNAQAVRLLANTLGVSYSPQANGDFDHAYAITLLNAKGVAVYQQTGLQPDLKEWAAQLDKVGQP